MSTTDGRSTTNVVNAFALLILLALCTCCMTSGMMGPVAQAPQAGLKPIDLGFPNGIKRFAGETFAIRINYSMQPGSTFKNPDVAYNDFPRLVVAAMNKSAGYQEFHLADGVVPNITIDMIDLCAGERGPYGSDISVYGPPSSLWFGQKSGTANNVLWFHQQLPENYITTSRLTDDCGMTLSNFLNFGWHG